MNDFHNEGAPRTRSQDRLIMKINSRLIDKAADHIQVGTWLFQGWGDKLPEATWEQLGIKLPYDVAKRLRTLSQDPWMTDPENMVYFPDKRDSLIALYEFLQKMRSVGRAQRVLDRLHDGTIKPTTEREEIRQLGRHDGLTEKQYRAARSKSLPAESE